MNVAIRILTCLCLFLPLGLLSQNDLTGNWKMTVPTEDGGTLPVQVSMKADGTYTVDFGADGSAEINGQYQLEGNQIKIKDVGGPQACPSEGIYTIEASGNTLKFTRVSDGCENRGGPQGIMVFTRA